MVVQLQHMDDVQCLIQPNTRTKHSSDYLTSSSRLVQSAFCSATFLTFNHCMLKANGRATQAVANEKYMVLCIADAYASWSALKTSGVVARRRSAVGPAWTTVAGDILFVRFGISSRRPLTKMLWPMAMAMALYNVNEKKNTDLIGNQLTRPVERRKRK